MSGFNLSQIGKSVSRLYLRTDNNQPVSAIIGNDLVVRVAVPLIEFNLLDYCGETVSGDVTFNVSTDGTLYQFNEAKNTFYNNGDTDTRGIDSDFRTKGT